MAVVDNATSAGPVTEAPPASGLAGPGFVLGALGILAFSFSFPATRLAVADLDPWLVAFGRATVAAGLAAVYLVATRAPPPPRRQARALALVGAASSRASWQEWARVCFFFSSRRRHTRLSCDWSSDVCSSDLGGRRI